MTYDLRVSIRNPDGSDGGYLRGLTAFSVQPQANFAGGATLSVPRNTASYRRLAAALRSAGQVELWLYSDGLRLRQDAAAVILEYSNGQDRSNALSGEIVTFTGRDQHALLDNAPSADIELDEPQYLPEDYGTPGMWVGQALQRIQTKLGAMQDITPTFTGVIDSAGQSWQAPTALNHGEGDSLLTMCTSLAQARAWDFRLRAKDDDSGWWLDGYVYGTMGTDRSNQVALEGNAQTVGRESGNVKRYNTLIATHTDITARVKITDPAAVFAAGRQIIKMETCPLNIADEAALADWARARLAQIKKAEYQVVHNGMRHESGNRPRFGRDYFIGDLVASYSNEAVGWETLRVESGRLTLIRNASVETTATVGYSFGDIHVQLYHGGDTSGIDAGAGLVQGAIPIQSPYLSPTTGLLTPTGAAQFAQDYNALAGAGGVPLGVVKLTESNNVNRGYMVIPAGQAAGSDGYFQLELGDTTTGLHYADVSFSANVDPASIAFSDDGLLWIPPIEGNYTGDGPYKYQAMGLKVRWQPKARGGSSPAGSVTFDGLPQRVSFWS